MSKDDVYYFYFCKNMEVFNHYFCKAYWIDSNGI